MIPRPVLPPFKASNNASCGLRGLMGGVGNGSRFRDATQPSGGTHAAYGYQPSGIPWTESLILHEITIIYRHDISRTRGHQLDRGEAIVIAKEGLLMRIASLRNVRWISGSVLPVQFCTIAQSTRTGYFSKYR